MNILRDLILFVCGAAATLCIQAIVEDWSLWRFRRKMGGIHGFPWKRIASQSTLGPHRYSTTRGTGFAKWSRRPGEHDLEFRRPETIVTPRGRVRDH